MNQYEMAAELADEIPEIRKDVIHLSVLGNAYLSMKVLATHTHKLITAHEFRQVEKCMRVAERIYEKGNTLVRNAVENVYVFSFSTLQVSCSRTEWRLVKAKMPLSLFSMYIRQIMKPGS